MGYSFLFVRYIGFSDQHNLSTYMTRNTTPWTLAISYISIFIPPLLRTQNKKWMCFDNQRIYINGWKLRGGNVYLLIMIWTRLVIGRYRDLSNRTCYLKYSHLSRYTMYSMYRDLLLHLFDLKCCNLYRVTHIWKIVIYFDIHFILNIVIYLETFYVKYSVLSGRIFPNILIYIETHFI